MDTIELKGKPFKYAALNSSNFCDLTYLFKAVYGISKSEPALKAKYDYMVPQIGYLGCFVYDVKGTPVGFVGAIPCMMEQGSLQLNGAQLCDVMTRKEYEGLGVFSFLSRQLDKILMQKGIKLVYALPNESSEAVFFNKLGWSKAGSFFYFELPAGAFPWSKIARRLPVLNIYYQKWLKRLFINSGEILTEFSNSEQTSDGLSLIHDYSFFKYKLRGSSTILCLKNGTVWLKAGTQLMVGDMSVKEERFTDLLSELKKLAIKTGLNSVSFQCQKGGHNYNMLSKALSGIDSWNLGYKVLDPSINFHGLFISQGDLDTF